MEEFVKNLAAGEAWTDATTVDVLARTLEAMIGMGIARDDVEAIVRREGGVAEAQEGGETPEVGDVVLMRRHDGRIVVAAVPEEQPESRDGLWRVVDVDGDEHVIERDDHDERWYTVVG